MCEGAVIQPIVVQICFFVKVTSVIDRATFVGYMLWGLVFAKGRIRLLQ